MSAAIDHAGFDFSRTIHRVIGALRRNFPLLATVTLLFYGLPKLGETLLHDGVGDLPIFGAAFSFTGGIYGLIALLGYFAIQPMIIYVLVKDNDGEDATLRGCLRIAMTYFIPVLAIMIIYCMALIVGLALLVVPGLMIGTIWLVATPSAVVEHTGITQSLERSRWLTRGFRWPVFGIFFAMILLTIIIGATIDGNDFSEGFPLFSGLFDTIENLVGDLLQIVLALVNALLVASIYCELRLIKEDASASDIASTLE